MPVLTLIRYKHNADFHPSVMGKVIGYCLQPNKTKLREEVFSVTGQNCVPSIACEQFLSTKASWGKTDGLCFRHYVQSFSPDEKISPMQANEIAKEFAEKAWQGYEVLIATHVDRAHIHSHLIVNTVHPETGKKLHESPDNIKKLRDLSDEICRSHGLSVLPPYQKPKVQGVGNGEYRKAIQGDSWKFRLCGAIRLAMERSLSRDDFIRNMQAQGYGVRWEDGRKNLTYTCFCEKQFKDGSYRKCRDNKLHDEKYLKENMEYEFTIRQKMLAALARGADPDEYADADTRRNPAGSRDSRADRRSTFGYGTNHFDTDPANKTDASNAERDGRTTQEGPPHDTESAGGDENTSAGERRTDWEDTRPSLAADGKIRFAGRGNLVASSAAHMSSGHTRLALGGLSGLASAVSMIGNGDSDESEEAKKEREARANGSALGTLIGTAIGAVTAINARCNNENTQEEQAPDIVQTPDIGEDEGESEHPFELSM